MPLTPLAIGTTALPLEVLTPEARAELLPCGALNLARVNALFKLLGDRIDAVDAADNAIVSALYNAAANALTFTMANGPPVVIPLGPLIADAVATGLITSSAYNAGTNILTLTTANADTILIDMTAVITDAVTAAIMPVGGIIMWHGAVVPGGWALCDGTSGTPDLRGRFIVGYNGTYPLNSTGGSALHNHTAATGAAGAHSHGGVTAGHALTVAEMPPHQHGNGVGDQVATSMVYGTQAATSGSNMNNDAGAGTLEGLTSSVGSGDAHTHALTAATDHTHTLADDSSLPPYYALAYIMKV